MSGGDRQGLIDMFKSALDEDDGPVVRPDVLSNNGIAFRSTQRQADTEALTVTPTTWNWTIALLGLVGILVILVVYLVMDRSEPPPPMASFATQPVLFEPDEYEDTLATSDEASSHPPPSMQPLPGRIMEAPLPQAPRPQADPRKAEALSTSDRTSDVGEGDAMFQLIT